ncbi:hypothetical protein GGS21DRAFT_549158 [Xylaria nigripes]|nr:hypothetical protein GGS21DRAFT_549158 [Xylaria nigripes]
MVSIRRLFTSKKGEGKSEDRAHNGPRLQGGAEHLMPTSGLQGRGLQSISDIRSTRSITAITTQAQGQREIMALIQSGTSDSLGRSLKSRDQVATQVQRRPKTRGTEEGRLILEQPRKAVEQLRQVKRHAEAAVRYGARGIVAYNFSRTLRWNKYSTSLLPALQLKTPGAGVRRNQGLSTSLPAATFPPIDWLVLPSSTSDQEAKPAQFSTSEEEHDQEELLRACSPVSEPGSRRDSPGMDIADLGQNFTGVTSIRQTEERFKLDNEEYEKDEGEYDPYDVNVAPETPPTTEASAIRITPVPGQRIRQVRVRVQNCGLGDGQDSPILKPRIINRQRMRA